MVAAATVAAATVTVVAAAMVTVVAAVTRAAWHADTLAVSHVADTPVVSHVADTLAVAHAAALAAAALTSAAAAEATAADLGMAAGQIAAVCARWDRLANLSGLLAAIGEKLPEAERLKIARCIRHIRKEQDEDQILRQLLGGLRLTGGWIVGKS